MSTFNPDQSLARWIELWEKRYEEFDQLPDVERRVARGHYEFFATVDPEMRELEREAERNGFYFEWTFDQDKNDFEYICRKMTVEEYEQYLEWEKEE
jgi:hypothetical protein